MGRILKVLGIIVGSLAAVVLIAAAVFWVVGGMRLNKQHEVTPAAVAVPRGDAAAIARGKHVVEAIALCSGCHGDNLAGQVLEDDPAFGRLAPANLTSGKGGRPASYTDADFVRAIRHGVGSDGKAIPIMPSDYYFKLSDADVGAIIAYLRSLPPVDNEVPESELRLIGRVLLVTGQLKGFFPATEMDHGATRPPAPEPGPTKEYGQYLTIVCTACHGKDLKGGPIPGAPPDAPQALNITSAGAPGRWTEAQFATLLRTGKTPEGRQLDTEYMPWENFAKLTDEEISAIYAYVKTVPG